jgi:hypothetical protein
MWDGVDLDEVSPELAEYAWRQAGTLGFTAPYPDPLAPFDDDDDTDDPALPPLVPHGLSGAEGHTLGALDLRNSAMCLALTRDGRTLYSGHEGGWVRAWDLTTCQLRWEVRFATSEFIDRLALTPDERWLACGARDHHIYLLATTEGALLRTLTGHTNAICGLAWSPDGRSLVSLSEDRSVRLW